ncbi:Tn3 family transposase [Nocardia sp. NBC_01009]|nr:Tn3 family transposase [Nocardia sp. NBC_01009]
MSELKSTGKPFEISKREVWEAWEKVKQNKGGSGVDGVTIEDFEKDLKNNLYKIWNRMSSGSYFPPPVRAVEILKQHGGGMRTLGIPCVGDRVAQTVVAAHLEKRVDPVFHPDSYGYRPGKSALDAVSKCRERCWKKDWVIDLDVQKFFDSVRWDLIVKAVEVHTDAPWVVLYVNRWLRAPVQQPDGTLLERTRGTPQGSSVSPVLANLFLHYAIELDKRTGYLDCFAHASGKQTRTPELKRNLIAVLLAGATNLGLTRMAEGSGISYDILSWTEEWYVREETLRAANLALIDYYQRLPLTAVFGAGTLSSSDGQRFPTRGKSTTARAMSRYFAGEGLSTYTHVTDQHATYGTKVIVATKREAHYVLDEILGNATDLPITEHATDTHGVTLVNFGLFDLLGMQLSPRIRDLGRITVYRPERRADAEARFPHAGPLMTRKANLDLIAEHWDDLLRLAGSLKFGHATASLLVGKLSASSRQNTLAAALKEYGALRRTIYAAKYLADPDYRRKISRQLNKGESLHALRRDLLYAHEGMIRARQLEDQAEQAWCLTLATNAVIAWTTEYYGLAVEQMRRAGQRVDDEVLAHISPAHSANINFFGTIEVDIDAELAQLGPTGYRPLRVRDTLF